MKQKNLKSGKVVQIYTDYQNLNDFEGKAELLEFIRNGETFILDIDEYIPERKIPLYSYEVWKVRFLHDNFICLRKIRYKL